MGQRSPEVSAATKTTASILSINGILNVYVLGYVLFFQTCEYLYSNSSLLRLCSSSCSIFSHFPQLLRVLWMGTSVFSTTPPPARKKYFWCTMPFSGLQAPLSAPIPFSSTYLNKTSQSNPPRTSTRVS